MKTILKIEIETPDNSDVIPEEALTEESYSDEEIEEHQRTYTKELHKRVIKTIRLHFKRPRQGINSAMEEDIIDNLEELMVEDKETPDDYGIKIQMIQTGGTDD